MKQAMILAVSVALSAQIGLAQAKRVESARKISGTITKVKNLQKVVAVEVTTGKHYEGKIQSNGQFLVEKLPDGTYFLMFKGQNDILEGLRFPDDVYAGKPLSADEKTKIEKEIMKTEQWYTAKQVWALEGGSQRAIAFVYNERTQDWFLNAGDFITDKIARRLDFYIFRRAGEEWKMLNYYMLHREEFPKASPPTWQHHHSDKLGSIVLDSTHPQVMVNY